MPLLSTGLVPTGCRVFRLEEDISIQQRAAEKKQGHILPCHEHVSHKSAVATLQEKNNHQKVEGLAFSRVPYPIKACILKCSLVEFIDTLVYYSIEPV